MDGFSLLVSSPWQSFDLFGQLGATATIIYRYVTIGNRNNLRLVLNNLKNAQSHGVHPSWMSTLTDRPCDDSRLSRAIGQTSAALLKPINIVRR